MISKAQMLSLFGNISKVQCQVFVEDLMICEAEINLFIQDDES